MDIIKEVAGIIVTLEQARIVERKGEEKIEWTGDFLLVQGTPWVEVTDNNAEFAAFTWWCDGKGGFFETLSELVASL